MSQIYEVAEAAVKSIALAVYLSPYGVLGEIIHHQLADVDRPGMVVAQPGRASLEAPDQPPPLRS
ncbi:hypothetical protein [Streptomyces telluris]|uniref:Uncharacterized protein n=1 Tax=Streptomyces telluris TaxID=2720021 RepID=A0A9X2LJI6_9ACTN|nr:hypothetical protein [Streptomyces telluris]MCQ8772104.1 hypothetical protein [Streptomyces telluris]NJP82251.1 hypothetical protein [Streptomyces telluris]